MQCLKYQTDQAQDIKRMEQLNNLFITQMCAGSELAEEERPSSKTDRPTSSEGPEKPASSSSKKRRGKK